LKESVTISEHHPGVTTKGKNSTKRKLSQRIFFWNICMHLTSA